MDSLTGAPSPAATAPQRPAPSPLPGREDCWSEEATFTLIDAWGERYLELNRGNLRQKHWLEVADAVNACHGHLKKALRTDVQCKNRIDTLKKKYKTEKARVSDSDSYASTWPFFPHLDFLLGDTFPAKRHSPPAVDGGRRNTTPAKSPAWAPVPVGPRSGTQKRPAATSPENSCFRRNFSAFAAAAAAAAEAEDADSENSNGLKWSTGSESRKRGRDSDGDWELGYRQVAQAIERFGEIYERVEAAKQRQMVDLEKQRMQFAKDLEYQRMQLFMETQVQLQKIKHSKRSSGADSFS